MLQLQIRSDTDKARALLQGDAPVYVSLAPSFIAAFPGVTIDTMRDALKQLGFADADETAVGATIVKKRYEEMLREGQQDVIISSCCHSVNLLLQKHYPEALPFLAQVQSPMQAHCALIRREHPDAKTVFVGPCLSKKDEADRYPELVDCVLTFEELAAWFASENIVPSRGEDHRRDSRARLFPTSGGILNTMDREPDITYMVVDGMDNCIQAIQDVLNGNLHHCFIEMSACAGSCIGGPIMEKRRRAPVRDYIAITAAAGPDDFPVQPVAAQELAKPILSTGLPKAMPGSAAITEILRQMGKSSPEQELNCGSCGYDTCREKAIAVLQGKADLSMCLPFLKEKAESFSDTIIKNTPNGIIVLNEQLEVQDLNRAACQMFHLRSAADVMGDQVIRILDPVPFMDVMQSGRNVHDQRVYLAEYNKYVEQSIIYDKSYHIIMSIMRDITDEENARAKKEELSRHTIEVTDKVIEKQMRVVQEIASLLGETTAETKIALTNLKESLKDE